jgi:hypothetical protein
LLAADEGYIDTVIIFAEAGISFEVRISCSKILTIMLKCIYFSNDGHPTYEKTTKYK